MKVHPLHDYVLIEPDKPLEYVNGIHLARTSKAETETGTVVAAGPRADIAVGARVTFKDYSLIPIKVNDTYRGKERQRELCFIRYEEIICETE